MIVIVFLLLSFVSCFFSFEVLSLGWIDKELLEGWSPWWWSPFCRETAGRLHSSSFLSIAVVDLLFVLLAWFVLRVTSSDFSLSDSFIQFPPGTLNDAFHLFCDGQATKPRP
jgi:hypothetical protein